MLLRYEPCRPLRWSETGLLNVAGVKTERGEEALSFQSTVPDDLGLLQLSVVLNQGKRPCCLPPPFIKLQ